MHSQGGPHHPSGQVRACGMMDEIRQAGTCAACRGLPLARLLADCIKRQFESVKSVNPEVEVFVWSDMLDPNHNAKPNYHLCWGDLRGAWRYVPKETVTSEWGFRTGAFAVMGGEKDRLKAFRVLRRVLKLLKEDTKSEGNHPRQLAELLRWGSRIRRLSGGHSRSGRAQR